MPATTAPSKRLRGSRRHRIPKKSGATAKERRRAGLVCAVLTHLTSWPSPPGARFRFFDFIRNKERARQLSETPFGTRATAFLYLWGMDALWMRVFIVRLAREVVHGNPAPPPNLELLPFQRMPTHKQLSRAHSFLRVQVDGEMFAKVAHEEGVSRQVIETSVRRTSKLLAIPLREMPKTGRPKGVREVRPRHTV